MNPEENTARVSNIELFFDLVFVFTITQVAEVIVHHPDLSGIGHALIELSVLAWMFAGYAWLTNTAGHLLAQCRIVLVVDDDVLNRRVAIGAGHRIRQLFARSAYCVR